MSEHPIIFSAEMVRAILEGRKTQTRRVIRFPKYYAGLTPNDIEMSFWVAHCLNCKDCRVNGEPCGRKYWQCGDNILPQQFHPGGLLWVRETHLVQVIPGRFPDFPNGYVVYRADYQNGANAVPGWSPSIFMPRWASRITLEITGVRVERVQEISRNAAIAEGMDNAMPLNDYGTGSIEVDAYAALWDSINAKRGYSWASNPWVWVIEFKPAQVPGEVRSE